MDIPGVDLFDKIVIPKPVFDSKLMRLFYAFFYFTFVIKTIIFSLDFNISNNGAIKYLKNEFDYCLKKSSNNKYRISLALARIRVLVIYRRFKT